jgi:hypothetical protein
MKWSINSIVVSIALLILLSPISVAGMHMNIGNNINNNTQVNNSAMSQRGVKSYLPSSNLYYVEFTVTGLPSPISSGGGVDWGITLNGVFNSTIGTTISFERLLPGTYHYTVSNISGFYASPPSGEIELSSNITISITFNSLWGSAGFIETGLPSPISSGGGVDWGITLNGVFKSTIGTTISFERLLPGTYHYTVSNISGFYASPPSGNFTISNQSQSGKSSFGATIVFTPIIQSVSFIESGLPSNTEWGITLNGTFIESTNSVISFHLMPGTYNYSIQDPSAYMSNISTGRLLVEYSYISVSLKFNASSNPSSLPSTHSISIETNNFPVYAYSYNNNEFSFTVVWAIEINNLIFSSYSSSMVIQLANGLYNIRFFTSMPGYTINQTPASHNITVNNESQTVELYAIEQIGYTVTINAENFPLFSYNYDGNSFQFTVVWAVEINGIIYFSYSTSQTITLYNGSYAFGLALNWPGFYILEYPNMPTMLVQGRPITVTLTAYPFNQGSFTESGLSSGTSWSVTFNGSKQSSTTSTITFTEPNGTYSYTVSSVAGYTVSPSSGSIVVSGSNISKTITYTTVSSSQTPLSGTPNIEIYGIIGAVVTIAAIGVAFALIRKRN